MKDWSKLRLAVLAIAGLETLVWLAAFIPLIRAGGIGDGFALIPLFFATPVFMLLVVPALMFVISDVWLVFAAILVALAALAYAFPYAPQYLDIGPPTWL